MNKKSSNLTQRLHLHKLSWQGNLQDWLKKWIHFHLPKVWVEQFKLQTDPFAIILHITSFISVSSILTPEYVKNVFFFSRKWTWRLLWYLKECQWFIHFLWIQQNWRKGSTHRMFLNLIQVFLNKSKFKANT